MHDVASSRKEEAWFESLFLLSPILLPKLVLTPVYLSGGIKIEIENRKILNSRKL